MRIGFITYEYPPDIARGGIATYVEQVALLLYERGHDVEIFSGSHTRTITENNKGVIIHRCLTKDTISFQKDCLLKFTERHESIPFDLIESPEILSNALLIKEKYPLLPMVVKLHMASFIQIRLLNFYTSPIARLRFFLGGLKRGKINFYGNYDYLSDSEYQFTRLADGIVAPSSAQKKVIVDEWHFPDESIGVIPNPYSPPARLLEIAVDKPVKKVVTFIGKLSAHKGIVNLTKAIPTVVKKHPDVFFRLIGEDSFFAAAKMNMSDFVRRELKGYENNYDLAGGLPYEEVLNQLESTAVCIFPSIWECFGLVCLEGMSAGRAVIGSKEGGMNDILAGETGVLIDPHNSKEMATAVIGLLGNEKLRWKYGTAARAKVLSDYNKDIVGAQMETHYLNTIEKSNKKSR